MASRDETEPIVALRELCRSGVNALPVDTAAVILKNDAGHGGVVYATSRAADDLEDSAFTLGEGPSVEAFARGEPVLVPDLDSAASERWPVYAQAARSAGCRAVFAFPLKVGAIRVGALTFYASAPTELGPAHLVVANALLAPAARAMIDHVRNWMVDSEPEGAQEYDGYSNRRTTANTFIRAEAYQASGMIMAQLEIPIDSAMTALRAYSFAHDRSINDVAHDVVSRKIRFTIDTR